MAEYRLSEDADRDLMSIAEYTIDTFGIDQARRYRDGLQSLLEVLVAKPLVGVAADWLLPGVRKHPYQSHVVFYEPKDYGVFVLRVLHGRMDAAQYVHEELG